MVERIAELVREKRIEGISDMRDESDRDGIRVVMELKRDAVAVVVLNQLYRFSAMQTSFGCNMIALNGGRPELLNIRDFLVAFIDFREEALHCSDDARVTIATARHPDFRCCPAPAS